MAFTTADGAANTLLDGPGSAGAPAAVALARRSSREPGHTLHHKSNKGKAHHRKGGRARRHRIHA